LKVGLEGMSVIEKVHLDCESKLFTKWFWLLDAEPVATQPNS
jgi:hypothetical protein